jgi:hypothetical protein
MDNQEKLNYVVKLAQSYILLFLKEHINSEQLSNIESLFNSCPVVIEQLGTETNEFEKISNIGGVAQKDKIIINLTDLEKININNETELNKLLGTIIHEYAHKIRAINNQYGEMLEESFASIFAEVCINNARLKLNDSQEKQEVFEMQDSVNYQKYESQVRGLLYILKQKGLDKQLIVEYIAGNQVRFKQTCIQLFGNIFIDYFNSISSKNNELSEEMLISVITQYIRQNGLNISDYWSKDANQLTQNNLYFRGSPTLCRGVLSSGIESFKPEEQEFYKYFESSVKIANDNDSFISQEKVDRIKQFIETKYSLKDKSIDEIYDTIIDLCSTYIQHQNRDDEESRIFIENISKIIPDIDDFKTKFVSLRVSGKDKKIFDTLDLNNLTYIDIVSSMNKLLQVKNIESENLGGIKR